MTPQTNILSAPLQVESDIKKKLAYTRETSQLENIVVHNIYNKSERNRIQIIQADPDLFDWAKRTNRTAVAVGVYKQGKETYKLGITLAKDAENWGAETLRLLELYAQCKNRVAGTFDKENTTAIIPIKEYADKRGYFDTKQRQRFKKQLETELLTAQSSNCYMKTETGHFITFSIFHRLETEGNNLLIKLHEDTIKYGYKSQLIKYSTVNKLALKSSLAYAIAEKLETNYSMDTNIKRGQHNIISVETLLDIAKKSLPTEAEAGNKPMQLRGAPIIKALDENLEKDILTSWVFCKANKTPMTEAEINQCKKEYKAFKNAYIHFEMAIGQDESYQNHTDTLKKKNQRTKAKK